MRKTIIYILFALSSIQFFSCKEESDPCNDKLCGPNETCIEGTCRCPDNFFGVGCIDQFTPTKINIQSIKILRYPLKNANNTFWDSDQKPDLHVTLHQDTRKIWEIEATIENADLPEYLITPSQPIILTELDIDLTGDYPNFTFSMYDDDGNKIDEFMAGVVAKMYQNRNRFPKKITFDTGGIVAFELEVTYN